jgi:hypothetical protein
VGPGSAGRPQSVGDRLRLLVGDVLGELGQLREVHATLLLAALEEGFE